MKNHLRGPILCVVVLALSTVVLAQTAPQQPEMKSPSKPRTPDGKPDVSGVWVGGAGPGLFGPGAPMELTKWGLEKFRWNRGPEIANAPGVYGGQHQRVDQDPIYHCYPPGLVRLGPPLQVVGAFYYHAIQILQTTNQVIIIYQFRNSVRRIYIDGREHPKNLQATWNGHSIGKWDGDTLVVDTIGLRDEAWLDEAGHEFSPQLHVVERFQRVNEKTLEIQRTLTDPVALAKPYTIRVALRSNPDYDLNDNMDGRQYDCAQFMVRKPAFGEGEGGLLGIADHP